MKNKNDSLNINIEEHLGLVHLCCQRFRKRGAEYEEIFQCGCIGLTKAAKNFDKEKGVKFSTYAVPVILGEIRAFFRNNSHIKISRNLKDLAVKVKAVQEKFLQDYSREPTISEICNLLDADKEQILEALEINRPPISLDDDLNKANLEAILPSKEEDISIKISLLNELKMLDLKDKNLIYLRFFKYETQAKVAKKLGMTQVQVSRREKVLLKILREKLT